MTRSFASAQSCRWVSVLCCYGISTLSSPLCHYTRFSIYKRRAFYGFSITLIAFGHDMCARMLIARPSTDWTPNVHHTDTNSDDNDANDVVATLTRRLHAQRLWLLWWLLVGCRTEHINSSGAQRRVRPFTIPKHAQKRSANALEHRTMLYYTLRGRRCFVVRPGYAFYVPTFLQNEQLLSAGCSPHGARNPPHKQAHELKQKLDNFL